MRGTVDLERLISQTVLAARLMERALHEPQGWTMQWGGVEVPVEVTLRADQVVLTGEFPEMCHLDGPPTGMLSLLHKGDLLGVRDIPHPGDVGFRIDWAVGSAVSRV